jgi:hypothetical protein
MTELIFRGFDVSIYRVGEQWFANYSGSRDAGCVGPFPSEAETHKAVLRKIDDVKAKRLAADAS